MKLILFAIFLGMSSAFAATPYPDLYAVEYQIPTMTDIEVRVDTRTTGILDLLQVFIDLLTNIVGMMTGGSDLHSLVSAIQNFFFTIEKMVNFRWIVNQVPFFGSFFSPILEAFSAIIGDSGMVGGLLSQILVGPDSDVDFEPDPETEPPIRSRNDRFGRRH